MIFLGYIAIAAIASCLIVFYLWVLAILNLEK
jgi:hypothetical protein